MNEESVLTLESQIRGAVDLAVGIMMRTKDFNQIPPQSREIALTAIEDYEKMREIAIGIIDKKKLELYDNQIKQAREYFEA